MIPLSILKITLLILALFSEASWADANSTFPDLRAFKGITAIGVASVETKDMETVRLDTTLLHVSIQKQLRQAGISVLSPKKGSRGPLEFASDQKTFGVLLPVIRRWESQGPLGTQMNSFALTLHFFQPARIQPADYETWTITWAQTQSLIVGIKRPQEIERALEKMVQSFLVDFQQGRK